MKKAVLIPDSFKGTMSSEKICGIMSRCIKKRFPDCRICSVPVADGGEGSVDAFLSALGGEKIYTEVMGPFSEPVRAFYGLLPGEKTAVIEMAACAGLPLAGERKDPERAGSFGVGQLMLKAASAGAEKIIVGLGGSACNDGGCGAAAAAGVKFLDAAGRSFVPAGGSLKDICRIDVSGLDRRLENIKISAMCDIDNPMYGENGAAFVFAPQKGADSACVLRLDAGLRHLSEVIKRDLNMDVGSLPGGGAAGAMGAGMAAFFGAELKMGIETVLDTVGFEKLAADADFIFTGEGKLDSQSLRGKVVIGVARRAGKLNKPVIAVLGGSDCELEAAYDSGLTAAFTINRLPQSLEESAPHSEENLAFAMDNILRLIACTEDGNIYGGRKC